jgi:hypothetical protein
VVRRSNVCCIVGKSTATFSLPDQLMGSPGRRRLYRHREVCGVAHLMV